MLDIDIDIDFEEFESEIKSDLERALAELSIDFSDSNASHELTHEQLNKSAISVIKYLLQTGMEGSYKDSIEQIIDEDGNPPSPDNNWLFDRDEEEYRGRFIDERPEGDRVFGFVIRKVRNGWEREVFPISGIDFEADYSELEDWADFGAKIQQVIKWQGFSIGVELLPGDIRFVGMPHERRMNNGYGHIRGYVGADKEALDCYLFTGFFREIDDDEPSELIFEVTQLNRDGEFDEHKFMIGFGSEEEAKSAYLKDMPKKFFGSIRSIEIEELERYRRRQ